MRHNIPVLVSLLLLSELAINLPIASAQDFLSNHSQFRIRQSSLTPTYRHRSWGRLYRGSGRRAILS